jgi:hypothetical protein
MLGECQRAALARHPELVAIKPYQVIEIITKQANDMGVMTALDDAIVKIEIAFALKVGVSGVIADLTLVLIQQDLQLHDLVFGHLLCCKTCRHPLECLANA